MAVMMEFPDCDVGGAVSCRTFSPCRLRFGSWILKNADDYDSAGVMWGWAN